METGTNNIAYTTENNPSFKSQNIRIEKNVFVWDNAVLPISNISSIVSAAFKETAKIFQDLRQISIFVIVGIVIYLLSRNTLLFIIALACSLPNVIEIYNLMQNGVTYCIKIIMNSGSQYNLQFSNMDVCKEVLETLTTIIENGGTTEPVVIKDIIQINGGDFTNTQFNSASNVLNRATSNNKK